MIAPVQVGPVQVRRVPFAEVAALVAELDADLERRYGAGGNPVHAPAHEFDGPGGQMLLAVLDGRPVGCVGLRRIDATTAELKRMYVRPSARRSGVGRVLLAACEAAARELGYDQLWLETGLAQPEAIALYTAAGYTPVARFGQYAAEPDSVHLGRSLGGSRNDRCRTS